jgi:AbiV family abortive infection protein
MKVMPLDDKRPQKASWPVGLAAVEAAIEHGGALYGEDAVKDFDAAFDHVVALLDDAAALFMRKSFNTSAFLSITAIEETAKAHIAIFRRERVGGRAKGRDPLRDHKEKHRMAIQQTVFMGERLTKTLGSAVCVRLQAEAESDGFISTREASLYCAHSNGNLVTPGMAISHERSWELLLLAIEALDDGLVGYTNHSMSVSTHLDTLFEKVASLMPWVGKP